MTQVNPSYSASFTKIYAIVAAGILIVFGAAMALAPHLLSASVLRGALIGGSIGAIMWPIMAFAQSFLSAEGRKAESAEAWHYAIRFAMKAMIVNLILGSVAVVVAFALGGVRVDEIGIALGVVVLGAVIGLGLQILMFRLFIWSAFKGAEKRAQRLQGG